MAEDMLPKPSVGRIVHYDYNGTCYAAMITSVWEDSNVVCLTVQPPMGHSFNVENVEKVKHGDPCAGHWHWPERV